METKIDLIKVLVYPHELKGRTIINFAIMDTLEEYEKLLVIKTDEGIFVRHVKIGEVECDDEANYEDLIFEKVWQHRLEYMLKTNKRLREDLYYAEFLTGEQYEFYSQDWKKKEEERKAQEKVEAKKREYEWYLELKKKYEEAPE